MRVRKKPLVRVLRQRSEKRSLAHVSNKNESKVLRGHSRKHPVPAKLGELMELVNLLPLYGEVDEKNTFPSAGQIFAGASWTDSSDTEMVESVQQIIDRLPGKLRDYIGQFPSQDDPRLRDGVDLAWLQFQVLDRYDFVIQGREVLSWYISGHLPSVLRFPQLAPRQDRDKKGRIVLTPSPLLECFEGVEIARIHRCPICKKIYWAARKDQPTCSPKCNNVRRSRIQRQTYIEARPQFQKKAQQGPKSTGKKGKHGS